MSKLERIVHDDSNGLDYILVGEIYLPLIAVPEEKRDIGFYGSLHRNYLKDYKYDLTQHPNYKLTAGADKKNTFSIEAFLDHRLKLKPGDKYEVVDADRAK